MKGQLGFADQVAIEDAALELGTTAISVLLQIKRQRLVAREVDGVWLVDRESLEAFRRMGPAGQNLELCRSACARKSGCGSCG